MLNEKLYKALSLAFEGGVRIVNAGTPAQLEYPIPLSTFTDNLVTPITTKHVVHGGEQYCVCCPLCGDKKHRLYFSYLWDSDIRAGSVTYHVTDSLVRCFNENCQKDDSNKLWIKRKVHRYLDDSNLLDAAVISAVDSAQSRPLSNQVP